MNIPARSISLHAAGILRPGVGGRVLASFERACNLVTDAGEVITLVWGGIGNGPLNVVLAQRPGVDLPTGSWFTVSGSDLHILPIVIDLSAADLWNPQPDWQLLRARRQQVVAGAAVITGILATAGWTPARCGLPEALCGQAADGKADAVCALVGLGPGLTPAGDDWLAGWLLAQQLDQDLTGLQSRSMSGLTERTTTLSRALLACAAAGETDESWHALLSALADEPMANQPICRSTTVILAHGATSGAAMLTGFVAGVERRLTADSGHLSPAT